MPVQLGGVEMAQVDAAQGDAPMGGVEEAQQQARQGRLAGAGRADDGRYGTGFEGEADVVEYRGVAVIAVAQVFEANLGVFRQRPAVVRRGIQQRRAQQAVHRCAALVAACRSWVM